MHKLEYNLEFSEQCEELSVASAIPGYLLHCLVHFVCLPYLIANGIGRVLKGRYRGVAKTRLLGGSPPRDSQNAFVFVGTALGETRTAIRAAKYLKADRQASVAVWVETTHVANATRAETSVRTALAPFNNPISALVGLLRWKPAALVFIENARPMHLVMIARLLGVPTLLANVKVSESRSARYRNRFMGSWRYRAIGLIAAQSEIHANRLVSVGVPRSMVRVTGPELGQMTAESERSGAARKWKEAFGVNGSPLVVAGSTHEPEEPIILQAFEAFRQVYPDAILVLAPRQTWRKGGADSTLKSMNIEYQLRSRLSVDTLPNSRIVLLDTQGELQDVYSAATVAFVGGTLVKGVGGHSPIEPLRWGVPVTIGPNYAHQEAVVEAVGNPEFLRVCSTADELRDIWYDWANGSRDPDLAEKIGAIFSKHGATYRAWHDIVLSAKGQRGMKMLRNEPIEHP
jgi:3-deoxy-D-manno-octulosonic-acid transferase